MIGSLQATVRRLAARAARRFHPDREVVAAEFDRAYYLSISPDVAAAGADPLDHFLVHGWREGRDPNARFSVREYLSNNPDVAELGVNPFVHYLTRGRAEGRSSSHDLGFRYGVIARQTPIEDQVAAARKATLAARAGTLEGLTAGLGRSRTGLAELHVTFSHDDYRANVGGVQLCLQREAARLAELGRDHLHLCPPNPWPVLRDGEEGRLCVLLNGESLGVHAPTTVVKALGRAAGPADGGRSFAIHSLLGHSAPETVAILEAVGVTAGFFWLHDFASLCAGYHLLRNGVEDCAAPAPDSAACGICVYGPWRRRHLAAHEELFQRLRLTVVSPARATLEFWRRSWDFPMAGAVVHPHARLTERGPATVSNPGRPLRVAYPGVPAAHKGWPLFRQLAVGLADDPRYAFFHLGVQATPGLPIEFREVRVTAERPRAMQEALEALEIDVVALWPLCRETFSFAAYEAIAAGCAILTGPDSGNVAAVVSEGERGWVLPDEAALAAAFETGEVEALARARRQPMLYDLTLSGMTADLLPARTEA